MGLPALVWTLALLAVWHAVDAATDEWVQQGKLLAADGASGDGLGQSVALSGDTALVGAGVYGASGAAYVFRFDDSEWVQEEKLLAADGSASDQFGLSVALSRDRAIVGANNDDDSGSGAGAAYVFRFDGTVWVQEEKLLAADGAAFDQFGLSVALSGDRAIIGAVFDDDNGWGSGAAYVFRFDGSDWVQQAKLQAADGTEDDRLGWSVAVSGDTAIVGAWGDDDNGTDSGSAYVFRFDGSTWVEEAKLLAANGAAGDHLGRSVALSGDRALVGALYGDGNDTDSGTAYVFRFDGSEWVQEATLLAADGAAYDGFGQSVALSGDRAIVGANYDDDNGKSSGSAYAFRFDGSDWVQQAKLLAADGTVQDQFGVSVALSEDRVLAGAMWDDDNGSGAGAAYVFTRRELVVAIDIKPGNPRNPINPRSKGKTKVAVLSTNTAAGEALDFDALQVDPTSVRFGPDEAETVRYRSEDVDHDGDADLLLYFITYETGIACGDIEATLTGETYDDQKITGTDAIKTVGCDQN